MLTLQQFINVASNGCAPRVYHTNNLYEVEHEGRKYRIKVLAQGRFIYSLSVGTTQTALPPLRSRKTIANVLTRFAPALLKRHRAGLHGKFAMHHGVPLRALEDRYPVLIAIWQEWLSQCGEIVFEPWAD